MDLDTTPNPSLTELSSIHSTLHLIYHRNKNQHSNTKWWKWLSILKRSTGSLIDDIHEDEIHLGSRNVGGEDLEARISARARHLRERIVPRCYLAFSTVVADKQFSTLGVVLLAVLARLYKAIPSSQDDQDDDKLASAEAAGVDVDVKLPSYYSGEDVGEVVGRTVRPAADDDVLASSSLVSQDQPQPELKDEENQDQPVGSVEKTAPAENESQGQVPKTTKQSKEKKKKKKQKRGNDIDDIFGSLL